MTNSWAMKNALILRTVCLVIVLAMAEADGADRPQVTVPRATSGDEAVQPSWEQRLTVTVGPTDAEITGVNHKAIQAAVDYVARLGGGTVKLLPGVYRLRNAVFLATKVRLLGSGQETVLIKEPCVTTKLAEDSDWYDQEITLANADSFEIGDGVCLRAKKDKGGGETVVKRTLIARTGNRFLLDKALRENLWRMNDATAATLFPILSGELIEDAVIENLVLDGNRANNDRLDGNYAGCIFLQDCNRITIRGVTARNYNGDGISWQICHDVLVENCASENNADLGLHPGSGSQRPVMRGNTLRNNGIGIFFCWGVKYGLAEKNDIEGNRIGISIGHRDTDNLITRNTIRESRANGVLFRPERGAGFAGHRNRIANNKLINNGPENGAAIDIQGGTEGIQIVHNEIQETRAPAQRQAVRQGPETKNIVLENNRVTGFAAGAGR